MRALLFAVLLGSSASAQIIPWTEPPALVEEPLRPSRPLPSRRAQKLPSDETALRLPPATADDSLAATIVRALSLPDTVLLSSFDSSVGAGSVRPTTSWVGQVTQHATTITVAGTAQDDNGWGATGLSLDASSYASLFITAQRDPGNAAPTLFFQFEDRALRTKVYSLSTSLFAVGTLTTVQIPLDGWTINFGAHDLTGWSLGGGSVGTMPFRLTFDEVSFSTSAIPEPSTYAALLGLSALALAAYRRRR